MQQALADMFWISIAAFYSIGLECMELLFTGN